ncbi:MAG TPA: tautomerase family protein [Myxococcales bacterium]|jgi:phenylpyruvate tautomerase PptA (4-oxalocrotonate tautomerase family)|nr:tautomerase family protein [Myxococcales bacterium]
MPHLQFDLNFTPPTDAKVRFSSAVVAHFARVMDTGTDHIAVSLRCCATADLTFGRATDPSRIAFMNADLRQGRTAKQKRDFALSVIDELEGVFGVPRPAVYVIFTEHDGPDFQMHDGVLPSWSTGEDPLAHLR